MKTYKGKITYLLPTLFFPAMVTLAAYLEHDLFSLEGIVFIGIMWLFFLLSTLVPLLYKLAVGEREIEIKFMGFTLHKTDALHVQKINYGNLLLWGGVYGNGRNAVTHGKGLAILMTTKNGSPKVIGISEKLFGAQAIDEVKRALGGREG